MTDSSRDMVIRDEHGTFSWIMLLHAQSRRELSRKVKERNFDVGGGCGADCTGEVFKGSCELLRAYRVQDAWIGVVHCANYRDV